MPALGLVSFRAVLRDPDSILLRVSTELRESQSVGHTEVTGADTWSLSRGGGFHVAQYMSYSLAGK